MSAFDPAARALAVAGHRQSRRAAVRDRLRSSIAHVGGRLPGLHPSPPAYAISEPGAPSAIAGSTLVLVSDAGAPDLNRRLFDLLGGTWGSPAPGDFHAQKQTPVTQHYGNAVSVSAGEGSATGPRILFGFDGDRCEIVISDGEFRLLVDGDYIKAGAFVTGRGSGDWRRVLLTFPDARHRVIELETVRLTFRGVQCDPATPPYRPVRAHNLRVVVNADSFGDTTSTPTQADQLAGFHGSLGALIGRLSGQLDCVNSSVGGSGFLKPSPDYGGGPGNSFGQRVELDVIAPRPDVVFELGGLNDMALAEADPARFRAAVDQWLGMVTAALPDSLVVMTGPMSPNGDNDTGIVRVRDLKREVAGRYPRQVVFVDNLGDGPDRGWVTGRAGGRTGNASGVTGVDTTHPSLAGAEYLARRIVGATAAAL